MAIHHDQYANILEMTFIHIRGISESREQTFWREGIRTVEQLSNIVSPQLSLFEDKMDTFNSKETIITSLDIDHYIKHLPSREYYRIALSNYNDVIFLDIETTGLSRIYSYITMVGWIKNGKYNYYIKGQSTDSLYRALLESKVIVTFNGSMFDIPFLRKEFPDISIPDAHIDMRFMARRFGYSGGQKVIEQTLGLERPDDIKLVTGKDAISLWYHYLSGDLKALQSLIKYNFYDIYGMQEILDIIVANNIVGVLIPNPDKPIYSFAKNSAFPVIKVNKKIHRDTKKVVKQHHIEELLTGSPTLSEETFIGIDLTGSEDKASGCCILCGDVATTTLLKTDDELIYYVKQTRPKVVSIDSPLSLPFGRKKTTDDDETRSEFGIMRLCERELKRRGVNVYPCLIPSMQKLTARGIRLATKLREMGFPVIESFPGAAQDIMKIPRKRTDLHYLKQGLQDFGIRIEDEHVTHDELDAITSAVVGLFFWQGQFEALGNEDEDYLIVPDIGHKNEWAHCSVVGISGSIAAGKTTAAKMFESEGYEYCRFSDILEDLLRDNNIEPNRANLQEIGIDINQNKGQYWLCKRLITKVSPAKKIVIDGLRHPEDYTFFVERFGPNCIHMHIDTLPEICSERYKLKKNNGNYLKASNHPVERNVVLMKPLATIIVDNNNSLADFENSIRQIINTQTEGGV